MNTRAVHIFLFLLRFSFDFDVTQRTHKIKQWLDNFFHVHTQKWHQQNITTEDREKLIQLSPKVQKVEEMGVTHKKVITHQGQAVLDNFNTTWSATNKVGAFYLKRWTKQDHHFIWKRKKSFSLVRHNQGLHKKTREIHRNSHHHLIKLFLCGKGQILTTSSSTLSSNSRFTSLFFFFSLFS